MKTVPTNTIPTKTVDDEALARRLTTNALGRVLEHVAEAPSTMDLAHAAAAAGARDGAVFLSDHQTAGRGAHGRPWAASPGASLTFSAVVRPPRGGSLLTLAVGLGVAEALASFGVRCEVKWPNDVLIGGKKVAGILAETRSSGGRAPDAAVVGIGINLAPQAYPPDADAIDLCSALAASRVDATEVLARVLERVEAALELVAQTPAAVVARLDERLAWRGRLVRVDEETETAELVGLEPDGTLLLRRADGTTRRLLGGTLRTA
ncbi:MAG: biotin--[acetyl-CoA-carboxylase] ligase [Myxococcales bacterium]|nr:biotin--[acetyl-CoA-carboxylase] ligase [Myxococcales bacterium]